MPKFMVRINYSACKIIQAETDKEASDISLSYVDDSDIEFDSWEATDVTSDPTLEP